MDFSDFHASRLVRTNPLANAQFRVPEFAFAGFSGAVSVQSDWFDIEMSRVDTERICAEMIDITVSRDQIAWFMIEIHELVNNDFRVSPIQAIPCVSASVSREPRGSRYDLPAGEAAIGGSVTSGMRQNESIN